MRELSAWQNFYVIVGSSAGALIGLQFVVLSLIADRQVRVDQQSGAAFATPTIIHFSAVLTLAALFSAPWPEPAAPMVLCGLVGLSGLIYTVLIARKMRHTSYEPEFEDWLFHAVLPIAAYIALDASVLAARPNLSAALLGIGAAALLLLLTGIHNAWDAVTYHVYFKKQE